MGIFFSQVFAGLIALIGFALLLGAGGIFFYSLDLFGTEFGFTLLLISAIFLIGGAIILALSMLSAKISALRTSLERLPIDKAVKKSGLLSSAALKNEDGQEDNQSATPLRTEPLLTTDKTSLIVDTETKIEADKKSLDDKIAVQLAKLMQPAEAVENSNMEAMSSLPHNQGTSVKGLPSAPPPFMLKTRTPNLIQSEIKRSEDEALARKDTQPIPQVTVTPVVNSAPNSAPIIRPQLPDAKPSEPEPSKPIASKQSVSAVDDLSFEEKLAKLANIPIPPARTPESVKSDPLKPATLKPVPKLPPVPEPIAEPNPQPAADEIAKAQLDAQPSQNLEALAESVKEEIPEQPSATMPDEPTADISEASLEDAAATKPSATKLSIVGEYHSGGTHYIIFADGSIEARSQSGIFQFASMEDLRAFIAEQAKTEVKS